MGEIASQITGLTILYLTVFSGADKRKHHCSMFQFDYVIMSPCLHNGLVPHGPQAIIKKQ